MGTNKLTKKRARKGSRKGSGCRGQCYSPLPPKIRRFKSGKHLPSEELIKAAENKQLRAESQQKRASYSGNNWGADLYRKGSPPSNSSTMSRDSSGTRQRLRPWLESKISSGEIKGLEWVVKDKGIFKIPWKHGGKHDWTPENSRIFMEWAKHTGRYRQGIDEEDYATWKTRLRCAFNKAPDIEELKDKTDLNCSEPYRVYRLVPKKEMQRFLTPVSSLPGNAERTNIAPEKQRLPLLLEEYDDNHDVHYPSDLKSLPSGDLLAVPSATKDLTSVIEEQVYPSDPNTGAPETMVMVTTQPNCTLTEMTPISMVAITEAEMLAMGCVASKPIFSTFIPDETSDRSMSDMPLLGTGTAMEYHCTVSEIHIQLKYQNRVIKDKLIDGQQGCLITSDTERQQQRVVLFYPPKGQPETRQENQIMSLLPFMKDGVWITSRNGSIFAKRSCKCGVFHVSATGTNGSPEKLKRSDKEEMIFDFEGSFLPALEHCKQFGGVAPDPCVHLIFGQTCQLNQLDKNILISATITSQKAQECLQPPKVTRLQSHAEHLERVKIDDRAMVGLIDSELLVTTIGYCAASTENVIDSRAMDTT